MNQHRSISGFSRLELFILLLILGLGFILLIPFYNTYLSYTESIEKEPVGSSESNLDPNGSTETIFIE